MQKKYNDRLIGTSNYPSKTMLQIINNHTKKQQNMMKSTLLPDETNDYFVNVASNLLQNLKANNNNKHLITLGISKPKKEDRSQRDPNYNAVKFYNRVPQY